MPWWSKTRAPGHSCSIRARVEVTDAVERLVEQRQRLLERQRARAVHEARERAALDVLHHHEPAAALLEQAVQRRDVRVVELRERARLGPEALEDLRLRCEVGAHRLERDDA